MGIQNSKPTKEWMSGGKCPSGASLPACSPGPLHKGGQHLLPEAEKKVTMWNSGIHRKKKSQSMETEGKGRLAKRGMEQRDTGAGGPMGSREISFGRERVFH